jgi:hypothetical protein
MKFRLLAKVNDLGARGFGVEQRVANDASVCSPPRARRRLDHKHRGVVVVDNQCRSGALLAAYFRHSHGAGAVAINRNPDRRVSSLSAASRGDIIRDALARSSLRRRTRPARHRPAAPKLSSLSGRGLGRGRYRYRYPHVMALRYKFLRERLSDAHHSQMRQDFI